MTTKPMTPRESRLVTTAATWQLRAQRAERIMAECRQTLVLQREALEVAGVPGEWVVALINKMGEIEE